MEKQIVNIFLLLGFNYYMIKSWGTRKVTLLTVIGNSTLGMREMHREQPLMIPNGNRFPYRMITASARNTLNLWKRKVLILEEEQAGTERTLH